VLEAGEALEVVVGGADRGAVLDGQGRQVGVAASRLRSNGQWPSPGTTARTHGWSNQDVT
jgi:hypothetical protein